MEGKVNVAHFPINMALSLVCLSSQLLGIANSSPNDIGLVFRNPHLATHYSLFAILVHLPINQKPLAVTRNQSFVVY